MKTSTERDPFGCYDTQARLNALERACGLVELDLAGRIVTVNALFCTIFGYSPEALIGQPYLQLLSPESQAEHGAFWQGVLSGEIHAGKFQRLALGGDKIWIQATYTPIIDESGAPLGVIKLVHDITTEVLATQRVEQQSQLFDIIVAAHQSFLLDRDLSSACEAVFERLLSLTQSAYGFIGIVQYADGQPTLYVPSISNLSWDEATHAWYEQQRQTLGGMVFSRLDNMFGHVITHNTAVCRNNLPTHPECRGRTPQGHPPLHSFFGIPIRHKGEAIGMIGLANRLGGFDESLVSLMQPLASALGTLIHARNLEDERNQMEQVLRFNAEHDFLTKLPNRSSFLTQSNVLLSHFQRHPTDAQACCLALLDIDFFKRINDEYGHLAGDAVLEELAQLLMQSVRSKDLVARFGGEEFIMLLRDTSIADAQYVMDRTRQRIERHPFKYQDRSIAVTISIGLAPYQPSYRGVDDWIHLADEHLYKAKRQGRNRIIYSS